MKLTNFLSSTFLNGPKKYCPKCCEVKSLDQFTHGRQYVDAVCRTCKGAPPIETLSEKMPTGYVQRLAPFLPSGEYANRHVRVMRQNAFYISNSICENCLSDTIHTLYPYADEHAVKPISLFAPVKMVKKGKVFCATCAEKLYASKPKPGKRALKIANVPQAERGVGVKATVNTIPKTIKPPKPQPLPTDIILCRTCRERHPATSFAPANKETGELNLSKLSLDCRECRRTAKREYARKNSQYIKDFPKPFYQELKAEILEDLKCYPCFDCGKYHTEEKPIFYYDYSTLTLLPTNSFPNRKMTSLRLHKGCAKKRKLLMLL
jgi:hypothetical protein